MKPPAHPVAGVVPRGGDLFIRGVHVGMLRRGLQVLAAQLTPAEIPEFKVLQVLLEESHAFRMSSIGTQKGPFGTRSERAPGAEVQTSAEYVGVKLAAQRLGVSQEYVRRQCAAGVYPSAWQAGRRWQIDPHEVETERRRREGNR